jgi:hypothetical protein
LAVKASMAIAQASMCFINQDGKYNILMYANSVPCISLLLSANIKYLQA